MGLGLDPLGSGLGPWGGPGLITIKGVVPIGVKEIAVVFDRVPRFRDDGAYSDANNAAYYMLASIDPTVDTPDGPVIPTGKFKAMREAAIVAVAEDPDDDRQLIVISDIALEKLVEYELTVLYVKGDAGETFAGPNAWAFKALTPPKDVEGLAKVALAAAYDPYFDVANRFYALDDSGAPALTGWQLGPNLDFAHHGGLDNARKRIHRRMFAGRGRYLVYGTGYGVDFRSKTLLRPGDMRRLESAVDEQIRREPDVRDCTVVAGMDATGLLTIVASVDIQIYGLVTVRQQVSFQ